MLSELYITNNGTEKWPLRASVAVSLHPEKLLARRDVIRRPKNGGVGGGGGRPGPESCQRYH